MRPDQRRRPILLALALALAATAAVVGVVTVTRPAADLPPIAKGQPAPEIVGTTLDGAAFDLAALRGHPVIVNFWGPTCGPCRKAVPRSRSTRRPSATTGGWSCEGSRSRSRRGKRSPCSGQTVPARRRRSR